MDEPLLRSDDSSYNATSELDADRVTPEGAVASATSDVATTQDGPVVQGRSNILYGIAATVSYANNTSEARDFSMAEKNWLALLRMGLTLSALAAFCVFEVRFQDVDVVPHRSVSAVLGAFFAALAVASIVVSWLNYNREVQQIAKEGTHLNNMPLTYVVVGLFAVGIVIANVCLAIV